MKLDRAKHGQIQSHRILSSALNIWKCQRCGFNNGTQFLHDEGYFFLDHEDIDHQATRTFKPSGSSGHGQAWPCFFKQSHDSIMEPDGRVRRGRKHGQTEGSCQNMVSQDQTSRVPGGSQGLRYVWKSSHPASPQPRVFGSTMVAKEGGG